MAIIKVGDKATAPSVRPSLLLDFANSKSLDPRIKYSRSSTATYWDGKTTVKAEENILSNSSDLTAWADPNLVTSSVTAPDGTTTALKMVADTNNGIHYIYLAFSLKPSSEHTISFYAKADGYNYVYSRLGIAGDYGASFNLSTGTVNNTTGSTATITSVGNGWYRCSYTATFSGSSIADLYLFVSNTGTWAANTNPIFIGDNVSGIQVWGPQVEQRSSATAYTPTTTSPITRYQPVLQTASVNQPRFDHNPVTGESKGFLTEQSRVNYFEYSNDLAWWVEGGINERANYGIAPDGTQTAWQITYTGNTADRVYRYINMYGLSIDNTVFSIYVKNSNMGSGNTFNLTWEYFDSQQINYNFDTGVLTTGSRWKDGRVEDVGNGWFRISAVITSVFPGYLEISNGVGTCLIWGWQLEAGTFPTSYIPTNGSSTTRSSDICYSVDSAFTPDGTFTAYTEASLDYDNTVANINATIFSFGPDRIQVRYDDQTGSELLVFNPSFVASLNASTPTINSGKTAVRIGQNDFKHSFSGSTPNSDAAGLFDVPETMYIGSLSNSSEFLNGHIQKIAIYPAALDDAELQALTEE